MRKVKTYVSGKVSPNLSCIYSNFKTKSRIFKLFISELFLWQQTIQLNVFRTDQETAVSDIEVNPDIILVIPTMVLESL